MKHILFVLLFLCRFNGVLAMHDEPPPDLSDVSGLNEQIIADLEKEFESQDLSEEQRADALVRFWKITAFVNGAALVGTFVLPPLACALTSYVCTNPSTFLISAIQHGQRYIVGPFVGSYCYNLGNFFVICMNRPTERLYGTSLAKCMATGVVRSWDYLQSCLYGEDDC